MVCFSGRICRIQSSRIFRFNKLYGVKSGICNVFHSRGSGVGGSSGGSGGGGSSGGGFGGGGGGSW